MTNFETWMLDNDDRIYRYWVYKRMFTPRELEEKRRNQSCYEDDMYCYGRIEEAVELPDGDVLVAFSNPADDDDDDRKGILYFYKLSELRLVYDPTDKEEFCDE